MRKQMILAHLMAMRSALDALVLELTEGDEQQAKCCDAPAIKVESTYSGSRSYCANCGTEQQSGSDKVRGEPVNQTR